MDELRSDRLNEGPASLPPAPAPLLRFLSTPSMPCPYLPGRTERQVVAVLNGSDPVGLHDRLTQAGFRRSYNIAYKPACAGCNACVPVRVRAMEFVPNRTQRRIARALDALTVRALSPKALPEHYILFHSYQKARHADGAMADMELDDYRAMIEDSPVRSSLYEFRDAAGKLHGVCLTDRLIDGLSLVYSFFDPRLQGSPGAAIMLWHIQRAASLGLPHVYLGYWIEDSRKMAYKARFRPIETLTHEGWQRYAPGQ
ncbi:MAG: arginyltransferase [Alphaproteobacteria bacterium]|nr:arginyltransferase [Alphaproteobacteria bacterium]